MFCRIGVAAGRAKTLREFKIPIEKAVRPMKNKYGAIQRVKSTVSLNFSGLSKNPGAKTVITAGEKIKRIKDAVNNKINRILKIFAVNSCAACFPFLAKTSVKTGMNADDTAHSPKTRLCILGILKATKNASAAVEDPKVMAMNASRINPNIRDKIVIPLTAPADLLRVFFI